MDIRKCLICEQDVEQDEHGCLDDAGFVEVSFHYGSTLDQCKGFSGTVCHIQETDDEQTKTLKKLINSDIIEGVIHDKCFKEKMYLFRGYRIQRQTARDRTI